MVKKRTGKQVKTVTTNNGLEFFNAPFEDFCKAEITVRHHNVRHTPQKNGVAERMNETLLQCAKCMWIFANLSE